MVMSQNDVKYIIHNFYFDVSDERHRFYFEPSDYNGDVITNEKIFESIFGYMSKTLSKPMLEKPEQAILSVESLIKHLDSYNVAISYLFCYGFEAQVQHRWFVQKIEKSNQANDLKSKQMGEFLDEDGFFDEMNGFVSCEIESHESDTVAQSLSLTKDTMFQSAK